MFEKIVLATDLSPAWNEIVACAGEFKALGAVKVILTYVISVKFLAGMEGILQSDRPAEVGGSAATISKLRGCK